MPQVYSATHVDAPPQEIFDFLADYRNIPRLQPHFEAVRLVLPGARDTLVATLRPGSRWRFFRSRKPLAAYA